MAREDRAALAISRLMPDGSGQGREALELAAESLQWASEKFDEEGMQVAASNMQLAERRTRAAVAALSSSGMTEFERGYRTAVSEIQHAQQIGAIPVPAADQEEEFPPLDPVDAASEAIDMYAQALPEHDDHDIAKATVMQEIVDAAEASRPVPAVSVDGVTERMVDAALDTVTAAASDDDRAIMRDALSAALGAVPVDDQAEKFAASIAERGYPHSGAVEAFGAVEVEAWRVGAAVVLVEEAGVSVFRSGAVPVDGLAAQHWMTRAEDWEDCAGLLAGIIGDHELSPSLSNRVNGALARYRSLKGETDG